MPEVTQDQPTQPRPVDAQGRTLDQWGLPVGGPTRIAALAAMGKPDPLDEPDAWSSAAAGEPLLLDTPADAGDASKD